MSSSRRHQRLRSAVVPAPRPSQAQAAPMKRRRHYMLVLIQVPDRGRVLARLLPLLPARCLVGIGSGWSPPDRVRYDERDEADDSPERISASIQTLLDKIDRSSALDIIMVIGADQLPVPDHAIDLFHVLDAALNQHHPSSHAALAMICLQDADLHDWDALLGAKVMRVPALSEIGAGCFDDGDVVFRGGLRLTSSDGDSAAARTVPGVRLVVPDRARAADAARLFAGPSTTTSPSQLKILSRVAIDSVPVVVFRRSVRGRLQWNASPDAAHRLLAYWAGGCGVMSDGHGVFMEVIGGPVLFVYAAEGELQFRTVTSVDDEAKMVAVKQALTHSERYACPVVSRTGAA